MIKAVIFDCFGVLTAVDKWKNFVHSLPEDVREPARELNRELDSGKIEHNDFYEQIHQLTGRSSNEIEHVINHEMNKNYELLEYIRELKPDFKIGMLSNVSSGWIRDEFLTGEEARLFDDMLFSFEFGYVKPNPRIYEEAARRLGVQLQECVLIDDSYRNVEGAQNVGMQAVLYENFESMKKQLNTIVNPK